MTRAGFRMLAALAMWHVTASMAAPVTVASCGRPVTFDHAPRRAVIHDINMAEMAFALGLQPDIAGLTGISGDGKATPAFDAARGAIPELAPRYPSLEQILASGADLFVAGWYYGMRPGGEVTPDTLAAWHVPVLELTESCIHLGSHQPPASLSLLYDDELRLGRVFGVVARAQALVDGWRARVAEVRARVGARAPVRVFVYDSGEAASFTAGRDAIATAIIEAAGGRNVLSDMPTSWGTSSWDIVAQRDPEAIILLDYGVDGPGTLRRFLRAHPAMRLSGAVRNDRIVSLRYEQLTPGPDDIDAVERLARFLHPDAFGP